MFGTALADVVVILDETPSKNGGFRRKAHPDALTTPGLTTLRLIVIDRIAKPGTSGQSLSK
jgi:hypothetical protein